MPMTPKQIIKLLKANGLKEVNSNGSHRKLQNNTTGKICIVPYHNKDLTKGMEQTILKQAGLK